MQSTAALHPSYIVLFTRFVRTLHGNDPVEYQMLRPTVFFIHAEITVTDKLEAVSRFCFRQRWLQITFLQNLQGIRIQVQRTVFIVNTAVGAATQ